MYTNYRRSIPTVRHYASSTINTQTSGIVQFKLADVGEGIAECEVLKWHIKVGDKIKEFDPICEVQSDKATVEITSRYDGIVTKLHYATGSMAKVGSPLVDIDLGGSIVDGTPAVDAPVGAVHAAAPVVPAAAPPKGNGPVLATPAVRHIAKQKGIDLSTVVGTGREGRILKEDILQHDQKKEQPAVHTPPPATSTPSHLQAAPTAPSAPSPAVEQQGREQVLPLSGIRRVMARSMTAAAIVPHFGFNDEFSMDHLQHLRATLKPVAEARGVKLTYMPFFIKAASLALKQYPTLNSSINPELTELTVKHYHNIGVAMDTPHGLVVPNIKDVQDKSIFEIAQELTRLHAAALSNHLSRNDLAGGTFTISNIGTIGGTYASPVLVLPEVVIGAIGKIQKVPRYNAKGDLVPVHLLKVSWSADHRVVDGATMANFSNAMKLFVEKPEAMIADLK
jgi:2-oxoisovalerate dehydrogenase E2 component (dihydrolipoyl transacylase)